MAIVFDTILQKCTTFAHIRQLQSHLTTTGFFQNCPSIRVKLVELCAVVPFGDLDYAISMFDRTQSPTTNDWNATVRGLAQSDNPNRAISRYLDMARASSRPDALTCSFVFKACARVSALSEASQVHSQVHRFGFVADVLLQTTLVDVYAKGGGLDTAEKVFEEMSVRDIAAWNALICGFALGSRANDALALFRRLRRCGDVRGRPNDVTVVGALSACAQLGALGEGEAVHAYVREKGLASNVRVCNALIDMYAKCGSVDRAAEVFRWMADRSLVSWNTVIMGLAMHGHGGEAVKVFHEMVDDGSGGVEPDAITYLAVLCGCNHAGMVDEGLRIFKTMRVPPNVKHYGAVVDLLGRAGRLAEAEGVIRSMPLELEPDVVLWQTLLGACKTYGNVDLAEKVSNKLAEMGSNGCGDYVLLSNVYAAKQRWSDVGRVRETMRSRDVRKVPGFSFIEVAGEVHRFLNGDKGHERWREIYGALDEIGISIKGLGYVPVTSNVLHDIGEEDKENALFYHSEKLAIAFGLISTDKDKPIQVIKNLRICGDCHLVAKLISKAYDRVIVVRDRARFHRFKGGCCSCGDYW